MTLFYHTTQQVVGCDGILGSLKVEDECLRCLESGEADDQCVGFSGIFTPNAQVTGETAAAVIPRPLPFVLSNILRVCRCTVGSAVYTHTIRVV